MHQSLFFRELPSGVFLLSVGRVLLVKFFVFAAAVNANLIWLAVVGVLNSIVGLYYYLTVLKYVYLYRSEDEDKPLPITRSYAFALTVLTFGIILIGTVFAPWFNWATTAAAAMF